MARASGSCSPSAPSLGGKIMPSTGIIGSGFWSIKGISRRVVRSSTIEGSEKISPSQSGLLRVHLFDGQLEKISDPLSIANAALVACDNEDDGLLSFDLHSDGEGLRYLNASIKDNEVDHALGSNGSVSDIPPTRHAIISCLQMNGKDVCPSP